MPLKIPAKLTAAAKGKPAAARPSANSLLYADSAKSISSAAAEAKAATPKNANAASIEKKTTSEADDDAENEEVSQDSLQVIEHCRGRRGQEGILSYSSVFGAAL